MDIEIIVRWSCNRIMKKLAVWIAIGRIKRMERVFDTLIWQSKNTPNDIDMKLLKRLTDYYEGGKWSLDYRLDESGLLPIDLKRGVLSEDGVYDLLSDIDILLKTSIHASYIK